MKRQKANEADIDKQIGSTIRIFRGTRGISQIQLGKQLGISFQQVQKYENSSNRLSVSRFLRICETLEIDPAEFISLLSGKKFDPLFTADELAQIAVCSQYFKTCDALGVE